MWTWNLLGVPSSDLVRGIRKVSSDQVLNRIEQSISRFGGLDVFALFLIPDSRYDSSADWSKRVKDIQGCSSRVNLCQYLRIRSLRSGSSSREVWSNSFPLPVKSEFSSEGAATTGQFKRVFRLYDCLMLHEHPLISAESLEHKRGNYCGENRDMI